MSSTVAEAGRGGRVVVDASAMIDLLVGSALGGPVAGRLAGCELHAPAHFDAEVLSALERLHRAGRLTARQVTLRLAKVAEAPIDRHVLSGSLAGAWKRRHNLRLVDALYVELAAELDAPIVTTDAALAAATPRAELVGAG